MNQLKVTSVALTHDQIKFTKSKGNTSRFIRSLIDREIGAMRPPAKPITPGDARQIARELMSNMRTERSEI